MRTFLAVPVSPETSSALDEGRGLLREAWEGIRWVPARNFHITIVFLANRDEAVIEEIRAVAAGAAALVRPFSVELAGPEVFPPRGKPRVLVERIGDGMEGLAALREALRPGLEPLIGWETRPFRPHITLGRARRNGVRGPGGNSPLPAGAGAGKIPPFPADRLVLFCSETLPEGAVYDPIGSWNLGSVP